MVGMIPNAAAGAAAGDACSCAGVEGVTLAAAAAAAAIGGSAPGIADEANAGVGAADW